MDDELQTVADVGGRAHLEVVQGQFVPFEEEFGVLHHVEGHRLGGAALHLHAQGVGPTLAQEDAALLQRRPVPIDVTIGIRSLVHPGDGLGDIDVAVAFLYGFPVEAFQQFGMVDEAFGNVGDRGADDFQRVTGDDGSLVQGEGFGNQADLDGSTRGARPVGPIAEVGEDDLGDGLVGLDGEIAVGVRDGGIVPVGNGDMHRFHGLARRGIHDMSPYRVSQPDGVNLTVEGNGTEDKGNQYQELSHSFSVCTTKLINLPIKTIFTHNRIAKAKRFNYICNNSVTKAYGHTFSV